MKRRASNQLTLDDARRPQGRGGWRPNAGRPKGRTRVAHEARADFSSREPLHITLRVRPHVPWLRTERFIKPFRGQIALAHTDDFKIVHFNLENNHIHLIVESADRTSLSRELGIFKSRLARRINRFFGLAGTVFDDRYHDRVLRTPREVRNALRYVLNNYRHHAAQRGESLPSAWFDPFSSGAWFDGWATPHVLDEEWKRELLALPAPTRPPSVWLLTTGWRKHGLIRFDEVPGITVRTRRRKSSD